MVNKIRFLFFNIFYILAIITMFTVKYQNGRGFYAGILCIILIAILFVSLHLQNKDNEQEIDVLNAHYTIINDLYNLKVTKFSIKEKDIVRFDGENYKFNDIYDKETNKLIFNALNDVIEHMFALSLGHNDYCDCFFVPMTNKNIAEKLCFVDTMVNGEDKIYYIENYDTMEITMWLLNILNKESNGLKLGLNFLENDNKYELVLYKV